MGMYIQDDYWDASLQLPPKQQEQFLLALIKYHFTGEIPEMTGNVGAMFALCKARIDKAKTSIENGKKGGRPKTQTEPNNNPEITQNKPIGFAPNTTQDKSEPNPAILCLENKKENKEKEKRKRNKNLDFDSEIKTCKVEFGGRVYEMGCVE